LYSGVTKRPRHDLGTPVVPVQARLGDDDPDRSHDFPPAELRDRTATIRNVPMLRRQPVPRAWVAAALAVADPRAQVTAALQLLDGGVAQDQVLDAVLAAKVDLRLRVVSGALHG